jgi:dTMP kinase
MYIKSMNTTKFKPYIVFEGPDFTGKSTLIERVSEFLTRKNIENIKTGHPGSTPVGQELRKLIKDPSMKIDKHTRAIMLAADNYEFQKQIALPNPDKWLLADRNNFISSMAYQLADGIKMNDLCKVHDVVIEYRPIDVCFVLDIDFETRQQRKSKRGDVKDYFERDEEHFNNLRNAYKSVSIDPYVQKFTSNRPDNIIRIDARQNPTEVLNEVIIHLEAVINLWDQ